MLLRMLLLPYPTEFKTYCLYLYLQGVGDILGTIQSNWPLVLLSPLAMLSLLTMLTYS